MSKTVFKLLTSRFRVILLPLYWWVSLDPSWFFWRFSRCY